jgi:hypothetical protein
MLHVKETIVKTSHMIYYMLLIVAVVNSLSKTATAQFIGQGDLAPPDQFLVRMPEGKPGAERPVPGLEKLDFCYNYDMAQSQEVLHCFETIQDVRPKERRYEQLEFRVAYRKIEPDDLVPIGGAVYRWDPKSKHMIRVDQGTVHSENLVRRLPLTSRINSEGGVMSGGPFQMDLIRFKETCMGCECERVQIRISAGRSYIEVNDRRIRDLDDEQIKERDPSVDCELWVKPGDVVRTKYWQAKLHRIETPNPDKQNKGWAEFDIIPLF